MLRRIMLTAVTTLALAAPALAQNAIAARSQAQMSAPHSGPVDHMNKTVLTKPAFSKTTIHPSTNFKPAGRPEAVHNVSHSSMKPMGPKKKHS